MCLRLRHSHLATSGFKSLCYLYLVISYELAANELAEKKRADHYREGCDMPAQSGKDAAGYHNGDRKMDCQYPLG
jgi:hypothetical protein